MKVLSRTRARANRHQHHTKIFKKLTQFNKEYLLLY